MSVSTPLHKAVTDHDDNSTPSPPSCFHCLSRSPTFIELQQIEDAFVKILGLKPIFFRPPYGNYNDMVLSILAQRGYKCEFSLLSA